MSNQWLKNLFPDNAKRTQPWGQVGETITLFRPVGWLELRLIAQSEYKRYPPRLPDQPIFYPVLNFEYAEEIARDWNVKHNGAGFVTRFEIRSSVATQYEIQIVGSESRHLELWVPARAQMAFEDGFTSKIEVRSAYYSDDYALPLDPDTNLPLELATL
jgi:hypothetical protein